MASEAAEPQAVQGAANDHDKENKFQQAIASWRSMHFLSLLPLISSASPVLYVISTSY
jgi:hypothetical protein